MTKDEDTNSCSVLISLLKELVYAAHDNEVYFSQLNEEPSAQEVASKFCDIHLHVHNGVIPAVRSLYPLAHRYDPCTEIKANGVRSWLATTEKLGIFLLQMSHYIAYKRKSLFFRLNSVAYKLKIHAEYLCALRNCLEIVVKMTSCCHGLICDSKLDELVETDDIIDIVSEMRQVNVQAFCGRTQCFHFCDSAQGVAQGILLAFATFSAAYGPVSPIQSAVENQSSIKSSGAGFWTLLSNPDVLGQQVIWALANFNLGVVKRFWQLGDNPFLLTGAEMFIPSVYLSKGINIHSVAVHVANSSGELISVEPPTVKPVKTRLISNVLRYGQEYWLAKNLRPTTRQSDSIVFQVHGGGFICQSSRAQEVYLRKLVKESGSPFFCVDYSLLPDDPFPRAIEEVVFAYCWMLNNFDKLGTTGKHIICIGDSAGACILLSMCIKLIELDIRLPNTLLLVYPYSCSSFAPSPSRLLALADPIVPIPLLVRVGCGYANLSEEEARLVLGIGKSNEDEENSQILSQSGHRRTISLPSAKMTTRKSVGSALGSLGSMPLEAVGSLKTTQHVPTHSRNMSDVTGPHLDLNFHRMRISESERSTLSELLALPVFADPLFSPIMASDEILKKLPHIHIVASTSDPLLDDSVTLCRRVRAVDGRCDLTVVEGVPHGFMNLHIVSRACAEALQRVSDCLQQLIREEFKESTELASTKAQGSIATAYDTVSTLMSVFSVASLKRILASNIDG